MALRAVVLAAGRGVRMGGTLHKALIPIDDHEPLLHNLLAGVKWAGVDDLVVVTGHAAQEVQESVEKQWDSSEATFLFNARYASWGNFHSVRVAIDQSPGADLLVVNSDIVIHPEVFTRVRDKEAELVLAVEQRLALDDEDMRVRLSGDRVLAIGKNLKRAWGHGEFCGVSLLRSSAARLYADLATDAQWRGETSIYYEDIYARMLPRVDARAATVQANEYAELDDPRDLASVAEILAQHRDSLDETTSTPAP